MLVMARARMGSPKILLLDAPFLGLALIRRKCQRTDLGGLYREGLSGVDYHLIQS